MTGTIFTARGLLPRPDHWVEGGGLLVVSGTIERLLESPAAVRRAALERGATVVDAGEGVLAPGLVCAHAHLELSALAGRIAPPTAMVPWVREVIQERTRSEEAELRLAAANASAALLASGTTSVGDVDSMGGEALSGFEPGPRRTVFREVLDAGDRGRCRAALESIERPLGARPRRREGVSAHAPHTASPELLAGVARLARRRSMPVQVHWSETREEIEWLRFGRGPFSELLPSSPGRPGLELLDRAGLLGPTLSLVHGNWPEPGEPDRIAECDAALVHCPGSHAFFDRPPFPLERYRAAGVTLALGTDSLASNRALDMRREMRLLRGSVPELDPEEVWCMATIGGAKALAAADEIGELLPGRRADFVCFESSSSGRRAVLEGLTGGEPAVRGVWIDGVSALGEGGAGTTTGTWPPE